MAFLPLIEILQLIEDEQLRTAVINFHQKHEQVMKEMPASTNYHHRYPGGYWDHVAEVCNNAVCMMQNLAMISDLEFTLDDVIVTAYFHDVDKAFYRYELDTEKPSSGQLKYAQDLNIAIEPTETKTTLSAKIDAAKAGRPLDPKDISYHKHKEGFDFDDAALVCKICAQHGIILSDASLAAVSQHHGGWSALMKANYKAKMSQLGTLIHCADLWSTFLQNGRSETVSS
jgi:hypothetical protein